MKTLALLILLGTACRAEDLCKQPSPEAMAKAAGVTLPGSPWHVANIWWDFLKPVEHFTSLEIDVTIDRDVPSDYNLYVSPCGIAKINDLQFYGGIQTNINGWANKDSHERVHRGKGGIFSRWSSDKKTPIGLDHVRTAADDCLVESAGYEGEFASVRRPFAWTKGTYTYCITKAEPETLKGVECTWFKCSVRDAEGAVQDIGSLRFEGTDFTFWAKHSAFVEVYSTSKIPKSGIPKVNITFGWPRLNGQKVALKSASAFYPDKPPQDSPDCAWIKVDGESCVVEVGPIFKRDEAKRRHDLPLSGIPKPRPVLKRTSLAAIEPEFFDCFVSGTEGYPAYRIPSVVVTTKGSVLAFSEARKNLSDQAENDIVTKRSTDSGATWSPLNLIHDDGANSLNNPTAVVDQATGRILLMYQRIPSHLKESSKQTDTGYEGPNIYRNFLTTSDDDGVTWSKPIDVTRTTKRPERATTICSGPGIGIQLTRGAHRGRLIIPFNEGPFYQWQNFAVFSDDGGLSWQYGKDAPSAFIGARSQVNEVQMVELSDGSVRLDSRQFAGTKVRKTAVSQDGGETWSDVSDLADIRDPSCMAGVLRYSFDEGKGKILHTGPDSTKRDHGTVYLSLDDGATFPIKRELYAGSFAYSVPARLADGRVGVLFEADNHKRIAFACFGIDWLQPGVK